MVQPQQEVPLVRKQQKASTPLQHHSAKPETLQQLVQPCTEQLRFPVQREVLKIH